LALSTFHQRIHNVITFGYRKGCLCNVSQASILAFDVKFGDGFEFTRMVVENILRKPVNVTIDEQPTKLA